MLMANRRVWLTRSDDGPHLTALSWLLMLAIASVLALTWLMRNEIYDNIHEASVTTLNADTNATAYAISSQTKSYERLLYSFRGLIDASPALPNPSEFNSYYLALQQDQSTSLPAVFSFLSNQSSSNNPKFIATWVSAGPLAKTNLASVNSTSQALELARDNGQLVGANSLPGLSGFSLILPVYKNSGLPATVALRRAQLIGFMVADVSYRDLFSASLSTVNNSHISYSVRNVAAPSSQPIFLDKSPLPARGGSLAVSVPLSIPGHNWQLSSSATQDFAITQADQTMITLIIVFDAALVVLLLMVLYFQVQNRRERLIEQTKDEFVSLVSHQLRTPLTSIHLFIEMLLDNKDKNLSTKQLEYLTNVQVSTTRMTELVSEFLNVSKLELGQLEIKTQDMHLEEIVEAAIDQLSPIAHKCHVSIKFKKPSLPSVSIEPNLYAQIVNNLLSNAIYYTKAGGKIEVDLQKLPSGYQLDVSDTGIGIPEEARTKLFQRFYRAENAKRVTGDGSGLGLYLVKKIVDTCGGNVWYDSVEGQGSSFHVIIPLSGMSSKKK